MSSSYRPKSGYSERYNNASVPLIKMRLENEIVRKRDAETRRCETARSHDRYFHHWTVQNEKFDDWTSPRSARLSDRYARARETEFEVEERRRKLKQLYAEDRKKEQQALERMREEEENRKWEAMRNKVQHFRAARNAAGRELADRSQHESWKASSSTYKAFESELKRQQQAETWDRQLREKEEERARQAEEKRLEALEMERAAREEERRLELERSNRAKEQARCKQELDEQVALLRAKEREADEKSREYDRLISDRLALEAARDEMRKKEEERTRKRQNAEFLTKQHLARLRQRSREVAADLEAEMHQAQKLFPSDEQQEGARDKSAVKEQTRKEIARYLQLVEQHRRLEKERIQQTEFLFQEEAKKMWEKREKEWEAERMARRKLIEEVIAIQKRQIEDKITAAKAERERLLEDSEALARSLDVYREQVQNEEMQMKARRENTKATLLAQMEDKQHRQATEVLKEEQSRQEFERAQAARDEKHWAIAMGQMKL